MKKIFSTIIVMCLTICCFAQWEQNQDGSKACVLDNTGDVRLVQQNDNSYALVFSTTNSRFDKAQTYVIGKNKEEALAKMNAICTAIKNNNAEGLDGNDAAGVEHRFKAEKPEGEKNTVLMGHTDGAKGIWILDEASAKKALKLLK